MSDSRIEYLTEEEIAKIVVTEAENETEKCFNYIVDRIIQFRNYGDACLETDFCLKYASSKGVINYDHPYSHLMDLANTLINWIEYTQLARRQGGQLVILEEKKKDVEQILFMSVPFIERPEEQEFFQRKYGTDPKHRKDNRNLSQTATITAKTIAKQKVMQAYIIASIERPITRITPDVVDYIISKTGIDGKAVEDILLETYPNGSVGAFMTKYFEMAFKGRDEAIEFEKATVELFKEVFEFKTKHVGPIGLTPDVLLSSDSVGYQAIIDNKAYHKYSISNDHHNRMVHNYIEHLSNYGEQGKPLAFFLYIAGGFGTNIDNQIKSVYEMTGIQGSAVSVSNIIKMVERHKENTYSHEDIRNIFTLNRQVCIQDLI